MLGAHDDQDPPSEERPDFNSYQVLRKVRALLADGQIDEAERELQTALDRHSTDHRLPLGHGDFSDSRTGVSRFEESLRHAQAIVNRPCGRGWKGGTRR